MPPSSSTVAEDDDHHRSSHSHTCEKQVSNSSGEGDCEDYEEIEIEEGIEVEEDDGQDDLAGSPNRNGESSGNFNLSTGPSELLTTEKKDPCINYDSRNPEFRRQMSYAEKGNQESFTSEKDVGFISKSEVSKDISELHSNSNFHMCDSEVVDETKNPSYVTDMEIATPSPVRYLSGEGVNGTLGFEEKPKPIDKQYEDGRKRMASRLSAPEIRTENKCQAHICDFFARGWCIKGNLCRFLHTKDNVNIAKLESEGDVAAAIEKKVIQLDEGFRSATERPRFCGSSDVMPSSVGNDTAFSSHFSSEKVLPLKHDDKQRLYPSQENNKFSLLLREDISMATSPALQQYSSSKEDLGSFRNAGKESLGQNLPNYDYAKSALLIDKGSSPMFRSSFSSEYRSSPSGSVLSAGNYKSGNPSSYLNSLEERTSRSHYALNSHSLHASSNSLNSSFKTSFLTAGISPSYHISTRVGPVSFSSSSWISSPFGAQKVLDNDNEYCTLRSFSSTEPKNCPLNNRMEDSFFSADYRTKISSDDWEPSIPFRPSFFITTLISSPQSQYDPLCDSIDLPNRGDGSFKISFTSHQQKSNSSPSNPECNGDKNIAIFHDRCHEDDLNHNCHTSGKDSLTTDARTEATSAVDMQNEVIAKEENSSVASHNKGITSDWSRHRKDLKKERIRQNKEIVFECKTYEDVHKESKAMRHFRSAIVDFIKELLKPTWREGHLSKDAHNRIVKRAVDKVLSRLQSNQNPVTAESIKQYLSLSKPKITKLIEGYVGKYRKS